MVMWKFLLVCITIQIETIVIGKQGGNVVYQYTTTITINWWFETDNKNTNYHHDDGLKDCKFARLVRREYRDL